MSQKFPLGTVVATAAALEALRESDEEASFFLGRHARGDWGVVSESDAHENDLAVQDGGRIVSAYILLSDVRIWIITEADRSATTVLSPDDY